MNDSYFESDNTFGSFGGTDDFNLGSTEETNFNPFEAEQEEQAEPAPMPRQNEIKPQTYHRETEVKVEEKQAAKPQNTSPMGEADPFAAALAKAEDDRDELATRVYIVIGKLNQYFPEISARISNGGSYLPVPLSTIVRGIPSEFPQYWTEAVSYRKPIKLNKVAIRK